MTTTMKVSVKRSSTKAPVCVIRKERLLAALEVLDTISSRGGAPTATFVKIEPTERGAKFYLTAEVAGCMEVSAQGAWPFAEPIYMDRSKFFSFILAAGQIKAKQEFKFSKIGTSLSIVNGTRRAKIGCGVEVTGYGEPPTGGTTFPVDAEIVNMLQRAKQCILQPEWSMQELETVMLHSEADGLAFYSTTGMLFFRGFLQSKVKLPKPAPFPLMLIDLMKHKSLNAVQITGKDTVLVFKQGRLWQETNAVAKKKFPLESFSATVAKSRKTLKPSVTMYSTALATALSRLVSYLSTVRKADWVLTLVGRESEGSKLELLVDTGGAKFRERISLKSPATQDIDIDWPLDKVSGILIDIAEKGRVLQVSFDEKGRAYVQAGSSIELLVPRRVR